MAKQSISNSSGAAEHAIADAAVDAAGVSAEGNVADQSWAKMSGPQGQLTIPAALTREQTALLELQESLSDAAREQGMALNAGQFLNGTRQILHDQLARLLDCTSYISKPAKPWARDYKGRMIEVVFDREYPQRKVLIDDFAIQPSDEVLSERRELCAQHGYLYAFASPKRILTQQNLEMQFAESTKVMTRLLADAKKKKKPTSTSET